MIDIVVVRSANSIIFDPRVKKIMNSLKKRYSVLALGWDRQGVSRRLTREDKANIRLFKLRTSFWKPSLIRMITRLLIFFPLFWSWILIQLLRTRPAVVHACDLDTAIPCYIYKVVFRKKLVFDIFDRYAMVFIPAEYKRFYRLVDYLEEKMSQKSDAVIIAGGEKVASTFKMKPQHCVTVLNCPEDYQEVGTVRLTKVNDSILDLVYTGGIRRGRGLEIISHLLTDINDVEFVIAGPVIEKDVLNEVETRPNIHFKGNLVPAEAIELELNSDAMIALYDPDLPWNFITLPNKLFEAMMCGVPIITNVATEIVNETQCGIIVEYGDAEQISQAIRTLRDDPELRKKLGDNGRKAFLQKYNWAAMERKLFNIYQELL